MRTYLCVLWCLFFVARPAHSEDISTTVCRDDFVKLLQIAEDSLGTVRFQFETEVKMDGKESPSLTQGKLTFDSKRNFYRLDGASVVEWFGGAASHSATRFGMSYDGCIYRTWTHEAHGTELPPVISDPDVGVVGVQPKDLLSDSRHSTPSGEISDEEIPGIPFKTFNGSSGLQYIPPRLNVTIRNIADQQKIKAEVLSEYLSKLDPSGITISTKDQVLYDVLLKQPSIPVGEIQMSIDTAHHGMVRSFLHYANVSRIIPGEGIKASRMDLYKMDMAFSPDGTVPESVVSERMGVKMNLRFSGFEFNPTLRGEDFAARFPPGTSLTDRVEKKFYRVGDSQQNEADAEKAFLIRQGL